MYKNLHKISTVGMSTDEWLDHRRHSIGGSDAAALVGMNPYATPYSVWADKLGMTPPPEENEAMRLGHDLEDYVAKRFQEAAGKRVRRENNIITNPDYPYAHANVDRLLIGEDAGLECKTTSSFLNMRKCKSGDFPDNYYVQCVHYMMVTGAQRWYLAVLALGQGSGFYYFVIDRDEEEIAALAKAEKEFWSNVTTKTPPLADGMKATSEAIKVMFPESSDKSVDLFGYDSEMERYMALTRQIKELEVQKEESANILKAFLEDAERGESEKYKILYKTQIRQSFDLKKFAAEHSDIDLSLYYKYSSARPFKVVEKNKEN